MDLTITGNSHRGFFVGVAAYRGFITLGRGRVNSQGLSNHETVRGVFILRGQMRRFRLVI